MAEKKTPFQSRLLKVRSLSPTTKEFSFEVPEQFSFLPGQFMMVGLPDDPGIVIRRAFSVACPPHQKKTIELCVKILPDGRLSSRLDALPIGSTITLEGPYGNFVLQDNHEHEVLFIAAGTGIAPIRSMIYALIEKRSPAPITLLFGFAGKENFLYQQELEQLNKEKKIRLVPVSSETKDWTGKTGYVQEHLSSLYLDGSHVDTYICGPPKMVPDTVKVLLKLKFKKIYREAW